MKIAIMSDIHSNGMSLKKAILDAKQKKVDDFFFLGDLITDGIMDNEVLDMVHNTNGVIIRGNRENYILEILKNDVSFNGFNNIRPLFYTKNHLTKDSLNKLLELPKCLLIKKDDMTFLLLHGDNPSINSVDNYEDLIKEYQFDVCLSGHTHKTKSVLYKGRQFLNPGSIGTPADQPFYTYGIYDTIEKSFTIQKLSTDTEYEQLKFSYLNSSYFEENPEWCSLILVGIKQGKSVPGEFIKMVSKKAKEQKVKTADEYNNLWYECYDQIKKEYEL